MKLMPNEESISYSYGITLTNFRIRNSVGESSFTSILLENIQSISMKYKSNPLLLLTGVLLIAASVLFSQGKSDVIIPGLIIGSVLIGVYYYTRRHYLTIASGGGGIDILVKGQSTTKLIEFIDLIEELICIRKAEMQQISE